MVCLGIPNPAIAEEYRTLRAELVGLYGRQDSRLSVAWAGVAAVLGGAPLAKAPDLGLFCGFVIVATCVLLILQPPVGVRSRVVDGGLLILSLLGLGLAVRRERRKTRFRAFWRLRFTEALAFEETAPRPAAAE